MRKIEVVRRLGEWKRDKAQQIVSAEFSRQHFDGIFAANDDMAVGAVAGLKAINVKQDEWPIVVGFDATRDGLTAVTSGEMYATIEQDARGLGAMKALMGEPLLPRAFLSVRVRRR